MAEDDHFLSRLSGFLAECDVPPTFESTSSPTGLFVNSADFLVETETFLSSLPSPKPDHETSEDGQNVQEDVNSLAAKKRELRNAQAAKRRLRYRQKLKGEKETLLQQEIELSRELNKLQRAQAEDQSSGVDRMALGVWRAIATRQKDRRLEAEQTQRQLRAAVIGRARMIHQMNALLQRPRVEEENRKLCGGATFSGGGDGAVLFKTFLGELDVVYAQTEQVMQEAEFQESEFRGSSRMEYKPKRTWKQGVELFDSADRIVLPLDMKRRVVPCHW